MVGMKALMMQIGQGSHKSFRCQRIDNMNEMLHDRLREIKGQPQHCEKLVDSLVMW